MRLLLILFLLVSVLHYLYFSLMHILIISHHQTKCIFRHNNIFLNLVFHCTFIDIIISLSFTWSPSQFSVTFVCVCFFSLYSTHTDSHIHIYILTSRSFSQCGTTSYSYFPMCLKHGLDDI